MAIRLLLVPLGVGVGIGIGIDPSCVLCSVLMHRVASLPEFRQQPTYSIATRYTSSFSCPNPIPHPFDPDCDTDPDPDVVPPTEEMSILSYLCCLLFEIFYARCTEATGSDSNPPPFVVQLPAQEQRAVAKPRCDDVLGAAF